jgi:ABC-type tungstate transport system substrate-binding protein
MLTAVIVGACLLGSPVVAALLGRHVKRGDRRAGVTQEMDDAAQVRYLAEWAARRAGER